jgi:hypothetical protein
MMELIDIAMKITTISWQGMESRNFMRKARLALKHASPVFWMKTADFRNRCLDHATKIW